MMTASKLRPPQGMVAEGRRARVHAVARACLWLSQEYWISLREAHQLLVGSLGFESGYSFQAVVRAVRELERHAEGDRP